MQIKWLRCDNSYVVTKLHEKAATLQPRRLGTDVRPTPGQPPFSKALNRTKPVCCATLAIGTCGEIDRPPPAIKRRAGVYSTVLPYHTVRTIRLCHLPQWCAQRGCVAPRAFGRSGVVRAYSCAVPQNLCSAPQNHTRGSS